jgi:hypothetical protein
MNAQLIAAYRQAFLEPQRGLQRLYEMGKRDQWNVDALPWDGLDLRPLPAPFRDALAGLCCQLHYGEVASLLAAARCVEHAQDSAVRMFAATQVMDEARHVEWFTRLIQKLDCNKPSPIHGSVSALIDSIYGGSTQDELFVGMQLIVEGLAQTVFQEAARLLRSMPSLLSETDRSTGIHEQGLTSLADWLTNGVARDESRHIAFGVLYLGQRVRQLSPSQLGGLQKKIEHWGQLLLAIPQSDEPHFATLGLDSQALARRCISDLNQHLRQAGLDVQIASPPLS